MNGIVNVQAMRKFYSTKEKTHDGVFLYLYIKSLSLLLMERPLGSKFASDPSWQVFAHLLSYLLVSFSKFGKI